MRHRYRILLPVALFASVIWGVLAGSVSLSPAELFSAAYRPILNLRIARVMLGAFTGAGLGLCGVALQAVLRNPLAEPYLLGTSSGAGLGAVIGVVLGVSAVYLPATAFAGAVATMFLVYVLAQENGLIRMHSLILSGVIVAVALSGLTVFMVSITPDEAVHGMMWWLLGSLQTFNIPLLVTAGLAVTIGGVVLSFFSRDLNAICLGEETALYTGVEVETVKKIVFVTTALITGALVSITGMIGFVGLVIPHMIRLLVGPDHRRLIPATVIGGAAFLVACDTMSRILMPPVEIPIGVVTSLAGAPLFIYLLKKSQKV